MAKISDPVFRWESATGEISSGEAGYPTGMTATTLACRGTESSLLISRSSNAQIQHVPKPSDTAAKVR